MDQILRQTLLFDFYGDLLTQHQREIYEDVVCNDISKSEVAEREGVSRQNIHELVRKCDKQMEAYEEKLHLMERFLQVRQMVGEIRAEAARITDGAPAPEGTGAKICSLCDRIMEEL